MFYWKNLVLIPILVLGTRTKIKRPELKLSSPPCGRSEEYRLIPDTVQLTVPPLLKKSKQTLDIFLGRCPMMI